MQQFSEFWRTGVGKVVIIGSLLTVFTVGSCVLIPALVLLMPSSAQRSGFAPPTEMPVAADLLPLMATAIHQPTPETMATDAPVASRATADASDSARRGYLTLVFL